MKTIYFFLIGSILCFSTPNFLNAQEFENPPQVLVDNTWYLTKLIIDEEEYPFIPDESLQNVYLEFFVESSNEEEITGSFDTDFCEKANAGFELQGNEDLYIWGWTVMASMSDWSNCGNTPVTDNRATNEMYFDIFWMYVDGDYPYHHQYIINQIESTKELIITNDDGNKAYFQNIALSVQDFEKDKLTLYPNPVKDHLYIENITENVQLEIYDLSGRKLLNQEINNSTESINVSQLSEGIYFYGLSQNGKKIKTGKLVKGGNW